MDSSKNCDKVELYLACRNLKNLDALSKSDPQIRLYIKKQGKWDFIGKTETRMNNLNPNFRTTFTLDFIFEVQQILKFEVVDFDDSTSSELIGMVETTLGAIVGGRNNTVTLDLTPKGVKGTKSTGKIIIRGETVAEEARKVFWQWGAEKLLNMDGYGDKSDPFLRFIKIKEGGDSFQVYDTEVVKDNLNPVWKPFEITDMKLCLDHSQTFKVECWDWEKTGEHEYLGGCEVTFDDIIGGKTTFELANYKKKQRLGQLRLLDFSIEDEPQRQLPSSNEYEADEKPQKPYQDQTDGDFSLKDLINNQSNSNDIPKPKPTPTEKPHQDPTADFSLKDLVVDQSQYIPKPKPPVIEKKPVPQEAPKPTFIDYLRSGTTLNTVCAIDFSSSNSADSLHAIHQDGAMNEYQKAIYCVCQILLNYDYDQQTAVLGFGAITNFPELKSKTTSDCFPCSGNFEQQQAQGIQGLMDVYAHALQNVEPSGPSRFAPLLKEAMNICEANKQANNGVYTILLIVTSGKVEDMNATKDLIVKAAALPLSVIIVGVGNGDFTDMEILDGDQGLTNAKGEKAKRDLVQFVPFREFNDMNSLAQRVLQEIPNQVVDYMSLIGRKP